MRDKRMNEVIGIEEEDIDKALKDQFGVPIRAPHDLKPGESFLVQLTAWCKIGSRVYGDYPKEGMVIFRQKKP